MKYVSPEVEFLNFDLVDVIETSTTTEPDPEGTKPPVSGDNQTDIG